MIQEDITGMRREISQAIELVDDAIGKLTRGFDSMGESMARGMPANEAARIRGEVVKVATALQFQDMVDQLLRHALLRLDSLAEALGRAGAPGQAPAPGEARPRPVARSARSPARCSSPGVSRPMAWRPQLLTVSRCWSSSSSSATARHQRSSTS